jgi:hypothetical protein
MWLGTAPSERINRGRYRDDLLRHALMSMFGTHSSNNNIGGVGRKKESTARDLDRTCHACRRWSGQTPRDIRSRIA